MLCNNIRSMLTIMMVIISTIQSFSAIAKTIDNKPYWHETKATIQLLTEETKNLIFENTSLSVLIKENDKPLNELLETDQKI